MKLIVCEKQVAAERIASILGKGRVVSEKKYRLPYFVFPGNIVVGLSGHILKVDFPDKFSSWSKVPFKELAKAELKYFPDKPRIIKLVKFLAKKASEVIIATDFDTEGESIGLEAVSVIKEVKDLPVKRMHYSAITPEEIISAYDSLTELDVNLANAADARREIDLVWGAVLTRFLSVSTKRLGKKYLSAGRVQSPTLSLIVEKEKERSRFKPKPYWKFPLVLEYEDGSFRARYKKSRVFDEQLRDELKSLSPDKALVKRVKVKRRVSKPPHPFNTTGFLRAAASLGFSGVNAMRIAESLYLKGLISYPRTDNQVYPKSLKVKQIINSFKGTKYQSLLEFLKPELKPTSGPKKAKDHPPIHPTGSRPQSLKKSELRLYELIVKRFLSTFARDSVEESTKVLLDVDGFEFRAKGYHVVKPGWRGVYDYNLKDDNLLPELVKGEVLNASSLKCVSKKTKPPRRYGHGTIIKAMNELNIGTKSTRPSIIKKLMDRFYIFYSKSLAPTPIAMAVMDALDSYANLITEPSMTRELEDEMELIASGDKSKKLVVDHSRALLLKALNVLIDNQDKIADKIVKGIRNSRVIGSCPKCGGDLKMIFARNRFVGCSSYPDCRNSFPLPQSGLLQVSNDVCPDCGLKKVVLVRKRKRPFVFCPNLDCPSREGDEETERLKKKRDEYLAKLEQED